MKIAEEILNKWCQFETHIDDGDFLYQNQRIRVLKAMEEYANQNLRNKLIKFIIWYDNKIHHSEESYGDIVDNYLNQTNK